MSAIMISIRPEFVEKILNGEKTIEIRKTKPKIELPCKVYIYCTKNNGKGVGKYPFYQFCDNKLNGLNGKVVAEFTLNKIYKFDSAYSEWAYSVAPAGSQMPMSETQFIQTAKIKGCLDCNVLIDYFGDGDYIAYMWHIDDLKIYDNPKELSEFKKDLDCDDYPCNKGGKNSDCKYCYYDNSEGCWACGIDFDGEHCIYKTIKRPPQSWCYVEELKDI